jgi:tRNA G18 (ribose-2'-O)-methylase SpoU
MITSKQLTYAEFNRHVKTYPLSILLDNIVSQENVGMIFRLADTLGVGELVLTGTTPKPPTKLMSRASSGAERHIPHLYREDALEVIDTYKKLGFTIIALEITNTSVDLQSLDYQSFNRILLIVGSENGGIPVRLLSAVDFTVHIPMKGFCLSMNVATSAAIAVYEMTKHLKEL